MRKGKKREGCGRLKGESRGVFGGGEWGKSVGLKQVSG